MLNCQLKPTYNWQISTQGQFILNHSLYSITDDYQTLATHLDQYEALYQQKPFAVVADADYGSNENHSLLKEKKIVAYIKYNYFDKEQKEGIKAFSNDALHYNQQQNCRVCPMRQITAYIGDHTRITASVCQQTISRYQAANCQDCPMLGVCHTGKGNRLAEVNHQLRKHQQEAKETLNTEQGIKYRKQRPVDVEPVFVQIKHNHDFRRCLLKGGEPKSKLV